MRKIHSCIQNAGPGSRICVMIKLKIKKEHLSETLECFQKWKSGWTVYAIHNNNLYDLLNEYAGIWTEADRIRIAYENYSLSGFSGDVHLRVKAADGVCADLEKTKLHITAAAFLPENKCTYNQTLLFSEYPHRKNEPARDS